MHYNIMCVRNGSHKTQVCSFMFMYVYICADKQIGKNIQRIPKNDYLELGINTQSLKKRQEKSEEDLTFYHHKISVE